MQGKVLTYLDNDLLQPLAKLYIVAQPSHQRQNFLKLRKVDKLWQTVRHSEERTKYFRSSMVAPRLATSLIYAGLSKRYSSKCKRFAGRKTITTRSEREKGAPSSTTFLISSRDRLSRDGTGWAP